MVYIMLLMLNRLPLGFAPKYSCGVFGADVPPGRKCVGGIWVGKHIGGVEERARL